MLHLGIPQILTLFRCPQSAIFEKFIFISTSKKICRLSLFYHQTLGLTLIYSGLANRLKMTAFWGNEIIISIPSAMN